MKTRYLRYNSKNNKKIISDINVTPFVDVMLVLLVIFMITSPLMLAGVNVDLPQSNANILTANQEPLTISISADNKVYIQESLVSLHNLVPKLKAVTKENKDLTIFLRGDRKVNYGKVIEVLGVINDAGYNKVSLVSEINNN